MITDDKLELATTWDSHVGADIGGLAPDVYGMDLLPLDPAIMEFFCKSHKPKPGEPYADWLAACHRPVCPGTGFLSLAFDLYVDENAAACAQALEFDTKLAIGGQMFNFSSQFNYATEQWQISGPIPWRDAGLRFGKFTPGVKYGMQFDYCYHVANKKYSFLSLRAVPSVGSPVFYTCPTQFQGMPSGVTNWKDSCNLQVQQDLNANGGEFSIYLRNIRYIWS